MTRSHWTGTADAAELEHWEGVAAEVAATLAEDALARDRANEDPHAELQLLREAGLVNLLDPAAFGGGGAHWQTAFRVIRILARADASVAQVLAYHYINSGNIGFAVDPARQAELYRRTVAGRWVWGDSVNPVDPDLTLTPQPDGGYRLDGTKRFSTGASVGDVVLAAGTIRGGDRDGIAVFALLDHDRTGIRYHGDWDALGQRLSASGSVTFDGVAVAEDDILGELTDEPFSTLITPGIQLAFGELYLGIAQGALARARELTLGRANSWFLSGVERYADDPFVLRVFGELLSKLDAVEALADAVAREFDAVVELGSAVTAEDRGRLAQRIARLKVVSTEVAIEVTTRVFEVTGSSSAKASVGLDLWWRNVRTHTLHDPVDYKKLEVGAYYINGDLQPISLYT